MVSLAKRVKNKHLWKYFIFSLLENQEAIKVYADTASINIIKCYGQWNISFPIPVCGNTLADRSTAVKKKNQELSSQISKFYYQ